MERFVVEIQSPLQRIILEQALALAQKFERAADSAPDGQVLDHCERIALDSGRAFLRQALASTLEQQVQAVEKSGHGTRSGITAQERAHGTPRSRAHR